MAQAEEAANSFDDDFEEREDTNGGGSEDDDDDKHVEFAANNYVESEAAYVANLVSENLLKLQTNAVTAQKTKCQKVTKTVAEFASIACNNFLLLVYFCLFW